MNLNDENDDFWNMFGQRRDYDMGSCDVRNDGSHGIYPRLKYHTDAGWQKPIYVMDDLDEKHWQILPISDKNVMSDFLNDAFKYINPLFMDYLFEMRKVLYSRIICVFNVIIPLVTIAMVGVCGLALIFGLFGMTVPMYVSLGCAAASTAAMLTTLLLRNRSYRLCHKISDEYHSFRTDICLQECKIADDILFDGMPICVNRYIKEHERLDERPD